MRGRLVLGVGVIIGLGGCPPSAPAPEAADASQVEPPRVVAAPRVVPVTTRSAEALGLFQRARSLDDNSRGDEALETYQKALLADPDFPFALAYAGSHIPGAAGTRQLKRALALSKDLPEAERLFIEYLAAVHQGEHGQAQELVQRLIRVAPDDWRVAFELGEQAFEQRKWALAVAAYKKSMAIVHTCTAYNNVAYAQAMQGHFDLGILALQKCIEMAPDEPNPLDSMGEIQLAAGKLDDAEASFKKALQLNPRFYSAWHGIACTRFYRGDVLGAHAALASAREVALESTDRLEMDVIEAWMLLAEGKASAALEQIDAMEGRARKLGEGGTYQLIWAGISRSAILHELGRDAESVTAGQGAIEKLEKAQLPGAAAEALRRRAWTRLALAQARLGKKEAVRAALAALAEAQAKWPDNPEIAATVHLARGADALARGAWEEAGAELSQCPLSGLTEWTYDSRTKPEDVYCNKLWLEVQEHGGDAQGAAKTRQLLAQRYSREPVVMYVRARLGPVTPSPEDGGSVAR